MSGKGIGYRHKQTFKVIREKHLIGFRVGTTVADLRLMLAKIPDTATVDDIDSADEDCDIYQIEFHHETV